MVLLPTDFKSATSACFAIPAYLNNFTINEAGGIWTLTPKRLILSQVRLPFRHSSTILSKYFYPAQWAYSHIDLYLHHNLQSYDFCVVSCLRVFTYIMLIVRFELTCLSTLRFELSMSAIPSYQPNFSTGSETWTHTSLYITPRILSPLRMPFRHTCIS